MHVELVSFPPSDGVVNGLECKSAVWFLDVGCKATKSIAQGETPIIGSKHFGCLESGFGVGAQVMDQVPELEAMLETV